MTENVTPAVTPVADETAARQEAPAEEVDPAELTTLHERTIAALSYISFLAVIPFYLKKNSKFCRFHGKQGMLLAILFYFCSLFMVLDILHDLVMILQFAVFVYGGMAALSGRWQKMPWIYKTATEVEKQLALERDEEKEGQ